MLPAGYNVTSRHMSSRNKPPAGASDFAAFHGVAALDVVAAGQRSHHAVLESHVEGCRAPDLSPRGLGGKAVHGFDVAAEIAHDIHSMRVQALDVGTRAKSRSGS